MLQTTEVDDDIV